MKENQENIIGVPFRSLPRSIVRKLHSGVDLRLPAAMQLILKRRCRASICSSSFSLRIEK
jgi:hypothetical protein